MESYKLRGEGSDDPITAIGASDKTLAVGRRSGYIHLYGLPSIRQATPTFWLNQTTS